MHSGGLLRLIDVGAEEAHGAWPALREGGGDGGGGDGGGGSGHGGVGGGWGWQHW